MTPEGRALRLFEDYANFVSMDKPLLLKIVASEIRAAEMAALAEAGTKIQAHDRARLGSYSGWFHEWAERRNGL